MLAVQVRDFAAVEAAKENTNGPNQKSKRPRFQPRQRPAPLSSVISLEQVAKPLLEVVPTQVPKEKEQFVLIKVYYAGIQYPDALQAQGLYQVRPPLPYTPGMDCSGIVQQASTIATTATTAPPMLKAGDRVMATLYDHGGTGACAQFVSVPVSQVWKLPQNVPLACAANIGRNYFAAFHSLQTIGQLRNKNRPLVLIDGASGGVGLAAVELAKALGAMVIAGVGTKEKAQYPQGVGADVVLCYGRTKETYRQFKQQVQRACGQMGYPYGVDLIIDMVHGELFQHALTTVVKPLDGKIVLVGFAAGQRPIQPGIVLVKELNIVGSIWGPRWIGQYPQQHRQNVQDILDMLGDGRIRPRVDRVFDLAQAAQAFEVFFRNGGSGRGNTVIEFQKEEGHTVDQRRGDVQVSSRPPPSKL